ncbi:hypothetical protein FQA39_LY18996 [Lamprigera yunnana]|nr:hypothetical protein FQA39_LY18996 [Lamprigera yunnana]
MPDNREETNAPLHALRLRKAALGSAIGDPTGAVPIAELTYYDLLARDAQHRRARCGPACMRWTQLVCGRHRHHRWRGGPQAVPHMLPKSGRVDDVIQGRKPAPARYNVQVRLHILIESPQAVHRAFELAAHPRVQSDQLCVDDFDRPRRGHSRQPMVCKGSHAPAGRARQAARSPPHATRMGKCRRAAGNRRFKNPEAMQQAAHQGRQEFGYTRMWSIHPAQIRPILQAFAPSEAQVAQAARIVTAAVAAQWAPISDDGVLHDRASYRYFWQVLEPPATNGVRCEYSAGVAVASSGQSFSLNLALYRGRVDMKNRVISMMVLVPMLAFAPVGAQTTTKTAAKPAATKAAATKPAAKKAPAKKATAKKSTAKKGAAVAAGAGAAAVAAAPVVQQTRARELAMAEQVYQGRINCELGASVDISKDAVNPGYFFVEGKGFKYHMSPVGTSTGTVRLEDAQAGAMWLQVANKSMLINRKLGQRMADDCMSPEQSQVAEAIKKNPPTNLFEGNGR